MVYIIMGVSGCGKTTIGKLLADSLGIKFYDADDFHPRNNIDKMKSNIPLDDDDRNPWLLDLASHISQWNKDKGAVLACSALKEKYRQILSSYGKENIIFIYLKADKDIILERLKKRTNHFFPQGLLESQLRILDIPLKAITIDADKSPAEICTEIINKIADKIPLSKRNKGTNEIV
ncbi:MAG: gluconokinase [Lentisphaerota bacterium]